MNPLNLAALELTDTLITCEIPRVHLIRPLDDARWRPFLQNHPDASVSHSSEWLRALRTTYGFEPLALTTSSPGGDLRSALLFCRVDSRWTGRRLVSLPFSDHCAPLISEPGDLDHLIAAYRSELNDRRLRYAEIRSTHAIPGNGSDQSNMTYRWHRMNLVPDLRDIASHFHKNCITRKIKRAERENLIYKKGNSEAFLADFWKLYLMTRRRHKAPPQPIRWFHNLIHEFGEALSIRIAAKDDIPIAAILTLQYKDTLIYKYGCSDRRFSSMGGTHLLFWKSLQEAKEKGLRQFDLGRSACGDTGLIDFKDRWGAQCSDLDYARFSLEPHPASAYDTDNEILVSRLARNVLSCLPDSLFSAAGAVLYKHIA